MRVLDYVPDEHRRILHRVLKDAAESSELTFLAYGKSPYYQMAPETLRRLNASSVIANPRGREQKTFDHLTRRFASEERIIPWWMWLVMRFSERGAILRTNRIENRTLVFVRQDVADLLADELKKRFGKPLPFDPVAEAVPPVAPVAAAMSGLSGNANAENNGDATSDSQSESGSWGSFGSTAPRDQQTLDPLAWHNTLEDVDEVTLNAELQEMLEYMQQLGFPQHQIQQILKDPELFRVMQTLKQVRHSDAELKRLENELLNLRMTNPEYAFAANSPLEAIDRIKEMKEERERELVVNFLRGQLLDRITHATQEALQAQQAQQTQQSAIHAAEIAYIAETAQLNVSGNPVPQSVAEAQAIPAQGAHATPQPVAASQTGVGVQGQVTASPATQPVGETLLPTAGTPQQTLVEPGPGAVGAAQTAPGGETPAPAQPNQAHRAGHLAPSLQDQVLAVQQSVAGSAIVADIQQVQRVPHEEGDRLRFNVELTNALAHAAQATVMHKAMEEVGFRQADFHAHHHHQPQQHHSHIQVETAFSKALELAMERQHHLPASGSTAKGFGIGH